MAHSIISIYDAIDLLILLVSGMESSHQSCDPMAYQASSSAHQSLCLHDLFGRPNPDLSCR